MAFEQLLPVFLSTPISHEPPSLPFRFTGGFAMAPKTIGFIMSMQGVYSMIAQIFLFPFLARRFGTLRTFRFVVMLWPILYLVVPYLVFIPERFQMAAVYFCLFWRVTAQVLAFPSHAILLANSAPSMLVLGVINGVAASTASLSRAFGPTVSGFIHSWGLKLGYMGLAWWANGLICALGALESVWLTEAPGCTDCTDAVDDENPATEIFIHPLAIDAAIVAVAVPAEASSLTVPAAFKPQPVVVVGA